MAGGVRMLEGRCECGDIRYQVADEFRYAANCHCSNCRAATGSAFKAFAGIEREKLEVVEGERGLMIVGEADENHTRCGRCGSLLFSVVREGAWAHVALGSLADDPSIRPTEHIFVGSKAPWYEITDDLTQNEEYQAMHTDPDRLREIPLFEGIGTDQLEQVASWFDVEEHPAGTRLTRAGASGYAFFILEEGHAR